MWCAKNRAVQIFRHNLSLLRRHTFSSSSSSSTKGLYGFPHLKSPKGFQPFVDEALQRAGELTSYIATKPAAVEIMRAMDEISDTVCSVVDSAELCRQTHPNRQFVEEANNASMRMNEYIHYLNTNYDLYDAVKKAEQECHMLSDETQMGLRSLRADMERGGIHLSLDQLNRVNILNTKVCQLCTEYNKNIVMDPGTVDIYPSSRIPKKIHYLVKPIHRSVDEEKGFRITTDPQTVDSVLQLASDDENYNLFLKNRGEPDTWNHI